MAVPGLAANPLDWPGAAPAKFTDRFTGKPLARRVVETECRNGDYTSLARQGFVNYFSDSVGLLPSESKRTFAAKASDVHEWRPARRTLSEPGAYQVEKPEGLKVSEKPPPKIYSIRERRHVRQVQSKEEHGDRPCGPATVMRDNGYRASDQIAQEIDVHNEMQRKVRPLALKDQRNGISCRALGDKNYRHPEYMTNFHHAGGLVVGATFQRGSFKKTEARNATSIKMDERKRRPMMSYAEKQEASMRKEAMDEVKNLSQDADGKVEMSWEEYALKECDSSNFMRKHKKTGACEGCAPGCAPHVRGTACRRVAEFPPGQEEAMLEDGADYLNQGEDQDAADYDTWKARRK
jgi:hypothetical protein